ncbi:MAG: ACT domain-containing protein [Pseudomonadota bacterium]
MSGERDLSTLLATLSVDRHDGVWAFASHAEAPATSAVMLFKEREGWTTIAPATPDTPADNRWVWLELSVYSDLQAVGFLAAVSAALAEAGVPCNAVAAFHHDHIFVPEALAETAEAAILALKDPA